MKGLLRVVGAAGATNTAITVLTLVNSLAMARILGPAGRGSVFIMLAFPTTVTAVVESFVQPLLVRRAAAAGGDEAGRLHGLCVLAALPLALATALFSSLLVLVAGVQLDRHQKLAAVAFAALWLPIVLVVLNLQALDLGRGSWRRYNGLRLLPYPLILVGVLGLGHRGPTAVLGSVLAAYVVLLAARLWLVRRDGGFERVSRGDISGLYRDALPFVAATGGTAALAHADQVIAATVLPLAEAGFYAVAQRAAVLLMPLAAAVGSARLLEAAQAPPGRWQDGPGRGGLSWLLLALTVLLAPVVWFAVPVLYGREFAEARAPATLALAAGLFAALAEVRERGLEGAALPRRTLPGRLWGVATLAAVAAPAGYFYGPLGVVAGSVVAQCVRAAIVHRLASMAAVTPDRLGPAVRVR